MTARRGELFLTGAAFSHQSDLPSFRSGLSGRDSGSNAFYIKQAILC